MGYTYLPSFHTWPWAQVDITKVVTRPLFLRRSQGSHLPGPGAAVCPGPLRLSLDCGLCILDPAGIFRLGLLVCHQVNVNSNHENYCYSYIILFIIKSFLGARPWHLVLCTLSLSPPRMTCGKPLLPPTDAEPETRVGWCPVQGHRATPWRQE